MAILGQGVFYMHAANIKKSDRLKRVASLLRDRKEYTTMDIIKGAGVCAVNSIISELRANGWEIDCTRRMDVWYYKLVRINA